MLCGIGCPPSELTCSYLAFLYDTFLPVNMYLGYISVTFFVVVPETLRKAPEARRGLILPHSSRL